MFVNNLNSPNSISILRKNCPRFHFVSIEIWYYSLCISLTDWYLEEKKYKENNNKLDLVEFQVEYKLILIRISCGVECFFPICHSQISIAMIFMYEMREKKRRLLFRVHSYFDSKQFMKSCEMNVLNIWHTWSSKFEVCALFTFHR